MPAACVWGTQWARLCRDELVARENPARRTDRISGSIWIARATAHRTQTGPPLALPEVSSLSAVNDGADGSLDVASATSVASAASSVLRVSCFAAAA
eukprot:1194217-Prorocentrum_minimum.AAC.1